MSKALSVETKVSAAIDPVVRVTLVTGPDLSPAWADMVAAETGLETSEATGWLLYSLQEGRPERDSAMAFLRELETVRGTARNLADAAGLDQLLVATLRSSPFAPADGVHSGSDLEVAAARDYAVLLEWWGLEGLLLLAQRDHELRAVERSVVFIGEETDPRLQADIELDEMESAELAFSLVGLAPDVTNFAVKATTVVAGAEMSEYSSIVSVAQRDGDLVWWEDQDNMIIIEGQQVTA